MPEPSVDHYIKMPDVLAFADKLPGFKPPTFLMFILFVYQIICYSSAMRWFEWGNVLQACLHKHFLIQISIWWNHQASCFHEYGNKKMSWLNCNDISSVFSPILPEKFPIVKHNICCYNVKAQQKNKRRQRRHLFLPAPADSRARQRGAVSGPFTPTLSETFQRNSPLA